MAISKIIIDGVTKMDVTSKTVDTTNLLSGYTATKNDGTQITGQVSSSALSVDSVTTTTSGYSLVFNGDVYLSVPSFLIVMLMSNGDSVGRICFYYYSTNNTSPSPSSCWESYSSSAGFTVNTSANIPTVDEWGNLFITSSNPFTTGTYIMYYIM